MTLRTLELFAGIGGMALALPPGFELVAAFDQDEAARAAHAAHHGVRVLPQDLATIDEAELARWNATCWLLSPPCQPFTRRGAGRDIEDPRCRGLLRVIELLPRLKPRRVLLENVVGFHGSRRHALLRAELKALGHEVADAAACPSEDGWPVRRPRQFVVSSADGLVPMGSPAPAPSLHELLDPEPSAELLVPPSWLERIGRIDEPRLPLPTITRSYAHSAAGGGPILPSLRGPRFLSPEEILRLHAFPPGFAFPPAMDLRTRTRLAGNSVHVASVRRIAVRLG